MGGEPTAARCPIRPARPADVGDVGAIERAVFLRSLVGE